MCTLSINANYGLKEIVLLCGRNFKLQQLGKKDFGTLGKEFVSVYLKYINILTAFLLH
jgi:hypothetical protein